MKKLKKFKIGDITEEIWCGDIVTKCEFIKKLGLGLMLFKECDSGTYRLVYRERDGSLNGWNAFSSLKQIKNSLKDLVDI